MEEGAQNIRILFQKTVDRQARLMMNKFNFTVHWLPLTIMK
jgi:hypothetical protein